MDKKIVSISILGIVVVLVVAGIFLYIRKDVFIPRESEPLPEVPMEDKLGFSSCIILDEEHCEKGEAVYRNKQFIGLGFILPEGTKIYAPFDGFAEYPVGEEIYSGFSIRNHGDKQRIFFNVFGATETTIQLAEFHSPERFDHEPVEKGQPVAETSKGRKIITHDGEKVYDIFIDFMKYDFAEEIWSRDIDSLQKLFNYVKI